MAKLIERTEYLGNGQVLIVRGLFFGPASSGGNDPDPIEAEVENVQLLLFTDNNFVDITKLLLKFKDVEDWAVEQLINDGGVQS